MEAGNFSVNRSPGKHVRIQFFFLAALIFGWAAAPSALADEDGDRWDLEIRSPDGSVIKIRAGIINPHRDGDHRIFLLHKAVRIKFDDTDIRADSVVLWYPYTESLKLPQLTEGAEFQYDFRLPGARPPREVGSIFPLPYSGGAPMPPPRTEQWGTPVEFYAEGNIKVTQGGACLYCDQIYTNLAEQRGAIMNGELFGSGNINDREHPIHFKASAMKKLCDGLYTMEEAAFSTCVFGVPHYSIRFGEAGLKGDLDDGTIYMEDASLDVPGLALPLPNASVGLDRNWYFPVKSLQVGASGRYGYFMFLKVGDDIDKLGQSVHSALGVDKPFKGDLDVDLNLMSKRGVGLGATLEYEGAGLYKGYMTGFHVNDKADEDTGDVPITQSSRGRVRTQNRINVGENTLLDLELSYISDPNFLNEYFKSESRTDKEQETYAYLHSTEGSQSASLLGRWKLNDFQSQNQYHPQGIWDITPIPVLGGSGPKPFLGFMDYSGIFYSHRAEISNVKKSPSDLLNLPSERVVRGDYISVFDAPTRIAFFKVTPFIENRFSAFDRTVEGDDNAGRYAGAFGGKVGFLTHANSDMTWDFMNINRIRNILEPSVVYKNNFAVTRSSDELIPIDEIEDVDEGEVLLLELLHRLQTRDVAGDSSTKTIYEALFSMPVYRDYKLSPTDHRKGELDYFIWITPISRHPFFGNPTFYNRGEFDPNEHHWLRHTSVLSFNPDQDWSFAAWYQWVRSTSQNAGTSIRKLLTDKWEGELQYQYDFLASSAGNQAFILRRRAHQWIFEVEVSYDWGDDVFSFSVAFTPLALAKKEDVGSIYNPMSRD